MCVGKYPVVALTRHVSKFELCKRIDYSPISIDVI
jgi:hypothetical protein